MTTSTAATKARGSDTENVLATLDVAATIVRDLDGTIHVWNPGAERLYGWSRNEAVGRRSHDLLATPLPQPLEAVQAALLADGAWHGELQHRTRDGRTLFVASHWALQRTRDGRPSHVVEINHDIGFREREITAMHRLAAIVELSDDAIIGKDLNGIVTHWNRAAEAMFGYRADEIVGRSIVVLFPPDRLAEAATILERIGRGEKVEHYETVRRRRDGSTFPVSLTVSPIRDDAGAIVGASKILRDLSEHHDREQRLREAQSELFHVQRLTELGQLISALVHEVNQPLAAIGNYAGAGKRLLAAGNAGATGTALRKITEQTEHAHQIIQRLRNFVKKSDSEQRPEHLPAMIAEGVALAMVSLEKRARRARDKARPGGGSRGGEPRADPAGAVQSAAQCHGGDGAIRAARDRHHHRPWGCWHDRDWHRRYRPRPCPGGARQPVPALRHHQGQRHGRRPVDLPLHRRDAWRATMGRGQPGWRHGVPLYLAERTGCRHGRADVTPE